MRVLAISYVRFVRKLEKQERLIDKFAEVLIFCSRKYFRPGFFQFNGI